MSQEKGIQTSFISLTSGVHSQLISNSSKMFSKFKVEKPSHVLYKRGARHFEAEKSGNILFLSIVEIYHQQIGLMRAKIERLKTMKSIDQPIIQSQVTELTFARAEALQLRQELQLQSDCVKEEVKKNPVRKICCRCCCFFSFKINSSARN